MNPSTWLAEISSPNSTGADDAVDTTVASLLIHFELLVVNGVDDHEAFVPVGGQLAEACSVVHLLVDVAEVAFDVA